MKASKLQQEFPQAHRILSELHFIKKLNEDLFQQLDDSRIAIDEIADKLPCASSALRGVRHVLDSDGGSGSNSGGPAPGSTVDGVATATHAAPSVTVEGDDAEENPILRTKKKLLQFVDDAVEKVATKSAGVAAAASSAVHQQLPTTQQQQSAKQLHEELQCLRLKIVTHENAKKALEHAKSRIDDLREELKTCRGALRETSDELSRTARERDTLRAELKAAAAELANFAQAPSHSAAPPVVPPGGHVDPEAVGSQEEDALGRKVNDLFDDLFAAGGGSAQAPITSARPTAAAPRSGQSAPTVAAASHAAVVQLSEQLAVLEKSKRDAEAKTSQLEATLTAAALEAEGLRLELAALSANRSSLDEANDALAHKLEAAVTQLGTQTHELAVLREAAKKNAAAAESHRVLSDEVKQLRTRCKQLEVEVDDTTAKLLSETQRREEAQREALALQRMLNSVELRGGLCAGERGRSEGSGGTSSSGSAQTTATCGGREDESGRSAGGAFVVMTEDAEEELFKTRMALRTSNKHRLEAESALRRAKTHQRITMAMCHHSAYTVGELALRAAASSELLRRLERKSSRSGDVCTDAVVEHPPASSLDRSPNVIATRTAEGDRVGGGQDHGQDTLCIVEAERHAQEASSERSATTPVVVPVPLKDCECQTTFPVASVEVQQLQADNRVLAHTVEELQEVLRSATTSMALTEPDDDVVPSPAAQPRQLSTSLSVMTSLPSTPSLGAGVDDELADLNDPPAAQQGRAPMSTTSPASNTASATSAQADAKRRTSSGVVVCASGAEGSMTPQRGGALSTTSAFGVASVPPVAGSSKRLGGFFQFMRRGNNGSKSSSGGGAVASSASSDAVSRQQLKVVQKLLEAQLRENLELQQRVEVLEDALKKSHRT